MLYFLCINNVNLFVVVVLFVFCKLIIMIIVGGLFVILMEVFFLFIKLVSFFCMILIICWLGVKDCMILEFSVCFEIVLINFLIILKLILVFNNVNFILCIIVLIFVFVIFFLLCIFCIVVCKWLDNFLNVIMFVFFYYNDYYFNFFNWVIYCLSNLGWLSDCFIKLYNLWCFLNFWYSCNFDL